MSIRQRVVVVGASVAGMRAAETLRAVGFGGELVIVGEEERAPYDRPPLSKEVLAGTWTPEQIAIAPQPGADDFAAEWMLGRKAIRLDVDKRLIGLDDGDKLEYDGLVVATGASARTIPGTPPMPGVHVLRTLDDCLALRADLDAGPQRVVVVGAGFIGCEVAATCRRLGLDVTVLDLLAVPLARPLGFEIGGLFADIHRDEGVDLRTGMGVAAIQGNKRVERVRLADGTTLGADVVVVGVGVQPNTNWLERSGLTLSDGLVCDETLLAAPGIVGAGDVVRWRNVRYGLEMRLEHWENSLQQGDYAAHRLLAEEGQEIVPFAPVPWYWSDQYERRLEVVGHLPSYDELRVVRGSLAQRQFLALYRRGDRVVGALSLDEPRLLNESRKLLDAGASWAEALTEIEPE